MIHGSLLDHFAHLYDCAFNQMHMLLWTYGSILCALPKPRTIFFTYFFEDALEDQFCVPLCAFLGGGHTLWDLFSTSYLHVTLGH